MSRSFYDYFKESMTAAGVPVPDELVASFSSAAVASASLNAIVAAVSKLGAGATIAEILFTATGVKLAADVALVLAAIPAAYYIGALIGAVAYATGQVLRDNVDRWTSSNPNQMMHRLAVAGVTVDDAAYRRIIGANA